MDIRNTFTTFFPLLLLSTLITLNTGCSSSDSAVNEPNAGQEQPKGEEQAPAEADIEVAFSTPNLSVSEDAEHVAITVVRQGNTNEPASVEFRTVDGSAAAGEDYIPQSDILDWSAGDSDSRTINIEIIQDDEVEPAESFEVELFNNSGTDLGTPAKISITINDDDQEQLACIELEGGRITENTTLSHPCYNVTGDVSVGGNATLTINPGVNLIFNSGVELLIEDDGLLQAAGTEALPIVLTGSIETPGFWQGLRIESIAPSVLHHTMVLYGGSDAPNPGNVVLSDTGAASIEHSQLQFGGSYGLNLSRNSVLDSFEGNTLTLNQGAPVRIHVDDVYTLAGNNEFTGNTSVNGNEHDRDFIRIYNNNVRALSTDQTWQPLGVPYRMPGGDTDVTAILTIEAGVEVEFSTSGRLKVDREGTLKTKGTAEQPVLITGVEKTSGSWDGIQFTFSEGDNLLEHTIVEYGGADGNTNANVGVFGQDGRLTIKDTTLRHSVAYGFEFSHEVDLIFERVTVEGNETPGSIFIANLDEIDTQSQFVGNENDVMEVTAGSSVGSQLTIHDLGIPFLIQDNIDVETDWVIEAGSELRFTAGTRVDVSRNASLAITGTEEQPVILTGVQSVPGYWVGIQYTFSGSQLNLIEHAVIEYAGSANGNTEALVGYFGQNSHGVIKNSVLRGSATHGIWLDENSSGEFDEGVEFEDIAGENIYRDL